MKKRVVKDRNSFWMYLVIILLLILIGSSLIYFRFTGNVIYNEGDYSSTDFAPPYDVFEGNKLIFTVSPENFIMTSNENFKLNITVNQAGGFIYNKAYYYNTNISDWVEFTFPQATVGNSSWIASSAVTELAIAPSALNNGNNLVSVYSCKKYSGVWECGCQTSDENNCARWMLQIVNVSSCVDSSWGACINSSQTSNCGNVQSCCSDSSWSVCNNGNKTSNCGTIKSCIDYGLVAYYPLDTNTQDYSGNGYNAKNNGANQTVGKVGGAYLFRGAPYRFKGAANNLNVSFALPRSTFTISAWIKPAILNQYNGFIVYMGNEYPGPGFGYGIGGGDNYGDVLSNKLMGVEASYTWMNGNYTFTSLNNWYQASVVHKSSGVYEYYINGKLTDNSSLKLASGNFPSIVKIGSGANPGFYWGRYFNGSIDELSFWNRSLSSDEISQLYNNGTGLSLIRN